MLRNLLMLGLMIAGFVTYGACEGKIDGDGDSDGDGDGDVDGDADSGEGECPMNSGAFCTCDQPMQGECDDGTYCLSVTNLGEPGDLGFCAPLCDCENYDQNCESTPYGATARCIIARPWPIAENTICRCVLMNCEGDEDCPPGQQCNEIVGGQGPYEGVTLWICSP